MFFYRVPAPDEAMLISGGKQKAEAGGQFRIVTGHGAWVMPIFRKVRFLSLETHTVDFTEKCFTTHGIPVNASAVVSFKVQNSPEAITAAAQRFLNDQKKGSMEDLTRKIFVGHLRGIMGRLTVEDVIRNREKLTMEVLEGSQSEMSVMGLTVDSFQIESFDDAGTGYIANMARPQQVQLQQEADVAQAKADQIAQAARQESLRQQAEQERNTSTAKAQYKAEIDRAAAEADAAGQLARAEAERQVLQQQQLVADTNAELVQRQLVADQIKPAEAEAQRLRIEADGQTNAAEANAKRAAFEAEGRKSQAIREAEARAQQVRLQAEADAARVTVTAQAARDAATFNAEATRAQGEAEAQAAQARGLAEAAAIEARGLAEAKGQLAKADALAANDNVQIELERVRQMSEVARAIADGVNLGGSNLTVLNGAEGLSQIMGMAMPLIQQVMTAFNKPEPEKPLPAPPSNDMIAGLETPLAEAKANGV